VIVGIGWFDVAVESERWRLSSRRRGDTIEDWGYCENLREWERSGQRKDHAAKTLTTNLETATVLVSEHVAHAYELVIRQIAALFRQVNIYSYISLPHFIDHDVLAVSISGTPFRAQYRLCQQNQESGLRSFPSRSMNTPSKRTIAHSTIEKSYSALRTDVKRFRDCLLEAVGCGLQQIRLLSEYRSGDRDL
jgi:hypothetical protein